MRLALAVVIALGCHPRTPAPPTPALRGLADYHTHQFAHLGFGSSPLSHTPDPSTVCRTVPDFITGSMRVKDLVRAGIWGEATKQQESSQCFPTSTNLASQRMDTDNLKRAVDYGLRLIVVMAVSSEFLCRVADLSTSNCVDRLAINRQLTAAHELETKIDQASGGPGKGWYRIVTTPQQARDVIAAGKLAVVLGVETSNAYGCKIIIGRRSIDGVPPLDPFRSTDPEDGYDFDCNPLPTGSDELKEQYKLQRALALFESYWNQGARHFFAIHNIDGIAGGAALFSSLLHADNNPIGATPAGLFNRLADINRVLRAVRLPFQSAACPRFQFDGGRCNANGLTPIGRALLKMMGSYGAMIDVDHMSFHAKREVLGSQGIFGGVYPAVSSHAAVQALQGLELNNESQLTDEDITAIVKMGGALGPSAYSDATDTSGMLVTYPASATNALHGCEGTSESFAQTYRYLVEKLTTLRLADGRLPFLGLGLGTDFTAPVPAAVRPRFARAGQVVGEPDIALGPPVRVSATGRCYQMANGNPAVVQQPFVAYPFRSGIDPSIAFDRSTAPWSGRTDPYDISFDGVAHVGMIPDFVEELRAIGLTADELEPLWHGAEAYVRAWDGSSQLKGAFYDEDNKGVEADCAKLRADLLAATSFSGTAATLDALRAKGCHGTSP